MSKKSGVDEERERLAREILLLSRNTLILHLRFLDAAISHLALVPLADIPTLAIDGQHLYYNSKHIIRRYSQKRDAVTRDMLHMIFHCLFHHAFVNKLVHHGCWDLACDIAAENAISDLGLSMVNYARGNKQAKFIEKIKETEHLITAEKIYRYYLDQGLSDDELSELRDHFYADNHQNWYEPIKDPAKNLVEDTQLDKNTMVMGAWKTESRIDDLGKMTQKWEEISKRAQVDIETITRQWGNKKGGLFQSLRQVTRERYDYQSFLEKFSVLGETMQVNDEEFDLVFYTYGISLYGNLPLIEPLEYKEVKRVKEFVIAIDTSGSVAGNLVQMFMQKTYNILMQSESFFNKVNIHIIQCDTEIQTDIKITNQDEFKTYIKSMKIQGFGGTDFRPVFRYVDTLINNHEFENLKGLIYFTDGFGAYPEKKPDYETAFVFVNDGFGENPNVPYWAIKLELQPEDVMEWQ